MQIFLQSLISLIVLHATNGFISPSTSFSRQERNVIAGSSLSSRLRHPSSFTTLFLSEDPSTDKSMKETYGFDDVNTNIQQQQQQQQQTPSQMSEDRLRNSLQESAKFKIKNDARFTWVSTFLVSATYAYGCLGGSDGEELLSVVGVPNGGILGGLGGGAVALLSLVLFLAPELLFGKRR